MEHQGNILDPIHHELDPTVWDLPGAPKPKLKEQHRKWIAEKIIQTLKRGGYTHIDTWLGLILTGSLTTYQYSPESDVDISLFVNTEHFPDWSRAEMIGLMVDKMDGTTLPGTTHPLQCFVVPPGVTKSDLYQPGLRSGYDLKNNDWVEPPDPNRVHDVETEMNGYYVYALESADKMEHLLKYEPDKAIKYWHQIHRRRQQDQKRSKGDYSESNIVYKFLANRGLFPQISEASGEYIAKVKHRTVTKFVYDPLANHLVIGKTGAEEGEHESHNDLINHGGLNPDTTIFGQFNPQGHVETFGRPQLTGLGQKSMNQYEADYRLKQALENAVPGIHHVAFEPDHDRWEGSPPQVTYVGAPPVIQSEGTVSPIWDFE